VRTGLERERNRVEHALMASLRLLRSLPTPS
jgi:hypothetical protein